MRFVDGLTQSQIADQIGDKMRRRLATTSESGHHPSPARRFAPGQGSDLRSER